MTGFNSTADAWSKVWADAQKQYMDAWMGLSRDSGQWPGVPLGAGGQWGGGQWAEAMQQWSRLMSQAMPAESQDVNSRLFDLGKSYMSLGETFWRLMQQGKEAAGDTVDWQDLMKNAFSEVTGEAGKMAQTGDPWSGYATFWGLPMDTWHRLFSTFTPFPGEVGKSQRQEGAPAQSDMNRAIRQMLAMPPVGYTREWQTQGQEWAELFFEYTTAMQAFMQLMGKVGQSAAQLFGKKLNQMDQESNSLGSLRAAYDLWIDCGEQAYAEAVATPEFPHLQAQMVNALMRLKRHEQTIMDEALAAMNIPTRQEMDTTHRRVYELQRQLCALQDTLDDLTDALEELEDPVETSAAATAVEVTAPVTKKTTTKKKASAKKKAAQPKSRAQTKSEFKE